ncbi:uncharacterized protein LOC131934582 [Physella acuta]|uniref:uncharacterized protein LOC131934582 n=1 Tax=Physella acuta TaxID=109671 RepID=UPI0027DDD533|nr:uncharacterized protein LOC131934582 [Physella acuta]
MMESLISLIIVRQGSDHTKELASINAFSPDSQVVDSSNESVAAFGKIDNFGESFIRLVWEFPEDYLGGVYICEAHGVGHTGHPVYLNSSTSVILSYTEMKLFARHLRNLTLEAEVFKTALVNYEKKEEEFRITLKSRLEIIKKSLFTISTPFEGRRYYLSYNLKILQVESAEAMCALFGGYLVEIDTADEHVFITQFLTANATFDRVLTGIMSEGTSHVWMNRHSNTTAQHLHWFNGYPKLGDKANCVYLWHSDWEMYNAMCDMAMNDFLGAYLCEVLDDQV